MCLDATISQSNAVMASRSICRIQLFGPCLVEIWSRVALENPKLAICGTISERFSSLDHTKRLSHLRWKDYYPQDPWKIIGLWAKFILLDAWRHRIWDCVQNCAPDSYLEGKKHSWQENQGSITVTWTVKFTVPMDNNLTEYCNTLWCNTTCLQLCFILSFQVKQKYVLRARLVPGEELLSFNTIATFSLKPLFQQQHFLH